MRFDRNVRYKIYSHGISNTKGKLMKNSFWLYLLKEHVPFYYVENYLCAYKDCAVKLNEFFFVTFMLLFEMALIPMKFCTFTELYFNCWLCTKCVYHSDKLPLMLFRSMFVLALETENQGYNYL